MRDSVVVCEFRSNHGGDIESVRIPPRSPVNHSGFKTGEEVSCLGQGTHFSTNPERMISLSLVSSGNFSTRQVATINRSAGSRWKDLGRAATSPAMAAEIGAIRTVRGWAAASNHSLKEMLKLILPLPSKVAVSHKLMSLSHGR